MIGILLLTLIVNDALKNAKTIEKSASKFAIKHAGVLAWKTLLARGGDVMYYRNADEGKWC